MNGGWDKATREHVGRVTRRMLRAGKVSIEQGDTLTEQQRFLVRYALGLAYRDLRHFGREQDARIILAGIEADVNARGRGA